MLPIVEHDPQRFRIVANVNPHVHHPVARELDRQLDHGAVALKIRPGARRDRPERPRALPGLRPVRGAGIPLIVHTGAVVLPRRATSRHGDPVLVDDVLRDFPDLTVVLAHGGRGWSYDAAASLALTRENVWLDLAGLPPKRLPTYYASFGVRPDRRRSRSSAPTPRPRAPPATSPRSATSGSPRSSPTRCSAATHARVFPGL